MTRDDNSARRRRGGKEEPFREVQVEKTEDYEATASMHVASRPPLGAPYRAVALYPPPPLLNRSQVSGVTHHSSCCATLPYNGRGRKVVQLLVAAASVVI